MYATRAHKRMVNNFETGDKLESSDVDTQMDGKSADWDVGKTNRKQSKDTNDRNKRYSMYIRQ